MTLGEARSDDGYFGQTLRRPDRHDIMARLCYRTNVSSLPALRFRRFRQGFPPRTAWLGLFLHIGILTGITAAPDLPQLPLPVRPHDAPGGKAIGPAIAGLDLAAREAVLQKEILSGNVPDFQRRFAAVGIREGENRLVLWVAPDYLAVGSDADYFRTPLH